MPDMYLNFIKIGDAVQELLQTERQTHRKLIEFKLRFDSKYKLI